MKRSTETLIATVAMAVSLGLGAVLALSDEAPVWVRVATFVATSASALAGAYGTSRPSDAKALNMYRAGLGRESDPE